MNDRYTLVLEGVITAEEPLTTSPPTPKNALKPDHSALPRIPLGGGDVTELTPYFPGGGLRGVLRRRAFDEARSRGESYSLRDYNYIVIGGVKGRKDDPTAADDKADLLKSLEMRERNPLVGLFGAGDPWATGCLAVGHAIPEKKIEPTLITGMRRDDFARGGEQLGLLSPEEQARWLETAQNNSKRSKLTSEIEAIDKKLGVGVKGRARRVELPAEEMEALSKTRALRQAELDGLGETVSSVSTQLPLAGYEVIPPGTRLNQRFVLRNARVQEIGLFLKALNRFAFDPHIGAKFAHGCGLVSGEWRATLTDTMAMESQVLEPVILRPYEPVQMDARLHEMMQAYTEKADAGEFDYRLAA